MNIAVIGSGNVSSWLINALNNSPYPVTAIYSRNNKIAKILAKKYHLILHKAIAEIEADLIFICVNDDSIFEVSKDLKNNKAILVHTSGSVAIDALQRKSKGGVLWPLQTLTASVTNKIETPICISSTDAKTKSVINKIAKSISESVYNIQDDQRKKLHLVAVMTNNFINHLVVESKEFMEENKLSYKMLLPILNQTFKKLTVKPYNFEQTGPAARGDHKTIKAHRDLIKKTNPEIFEMYNAISKSIFKKYNS